jgi:glycosyltransferase involved in cell wall biosynthesis
MTDVCGVLNLHGEGLLAHSSLISMVRAKAAAEPLGVSVELLVVADCPTDATRDYLQTADGLGVRCLVVDVDDLGLARNAAVAATESAHVAFLDGDDIYSDNWYLLAFEAASRDDRNVIWHPEANLYFGGPDTPVWRLHPDMDLAVDDWMRLAMANLWTSLAFARRELFLEVPYRKTELRAGFGFEDWAWNSDTISHGMIHKIVPGTVHLLRRKAHSLNAQTRGVGALMTPSDLFVRRLAFVGG